MSRAVIDQAGFRVVFIGVILSLLLGLGLRAQIAPARIRSLLQDSVSRLDKDFIIDFDSAQVVLSNWGLPLPSLQISNIRVSPRKSICQESQIYIEHLNLPLSLISLVTSESLITEINANHVELRIGDLNHCFDSPTKAVQTSKPNSEKAETIVELNRPQEHSAKASTPEATPSEQKNIFQVRTAALLKKINIDQLKLIYKKHPVQPVDFRHLVFEFDYDKGKLSKIEINSQVYALRDLQSDVMYFKGDLGVQVFSRNAQDVEAILKLNGRLLDGEVHLFALLNSIEKNIKIDMKATKVAVKPLFQLQLIESNNVNIPLTFDFRGYGFYQYDTHQLTDLKLSDIAITGERTHIAIDELVAKSEKNKFEILPFKAEIERLNLNKILNLSQNKNVAQSIENFGEFTGNLNFKNAQHVDVSGKWSDLQFIFANRGYREIQKLDSFLVEAKLNKDDVDLKLKEFILNQKPIEGQSEFSYDLDSGYVQAKADLKGPILNEKVWSLLTQVPQTPNLDIHWAYKKSKDERHQLSMAIDEVGTHGLKFKDLDVNFIQTLQDGVSSGVVLGAKSNQIKIDQEDLKINILNQLFNNTSNLPEKNYVAENFHMNLKGTDWRSMNFELDSHLKSATENKSAAVAKIKGDWSENDVIAGQIILQSTPNKNYKYQIIKKDNDLGIIEQ